MNPLPEKNLECAACKKPVTVCYTEITGKMIYRCGMCSDCPLLRKKLIISDHARVELCGKKAGLSCGGCGLTADEVSMGAQLGCNQCYEVFEDLIIHELTQSHRLNQKASTKKNKSWHIGRAAGQPSQMSPELQLLTLNQALKDTLSHEDYEQAAWLRDQIKALSTQQPPPKTTDEKK